MEQGIFSNKQGNQQQQQGSIIIAAICPGVRTLDSAVQFCGNSGVFVKVPSAGDRGKFGLQTSNASLRLTAPQAENLFLHINSIPPHCGEEYLVGWNFRKGQVRFESHFRSSTREIKKKLSNHTIDVKHAARVLLSNLLDLTRRKARFSKRVHRGQVSRRE